MSIGLVAQFFASALAVILAARWLSRAGDKIALATGMEHLFVGTLFLAASTSAPEFFVDVQATVEGAPNLAAGDLLGSSLMNLMIFSLITLIFRPPPSKKVTFASGWTALLAALLTVLVALFIAFPFSWRFFGMGLGSYLLLFVYLLGIRLIFKRKRLDRPIEKRKKVNRKETVTAVLNFLLATGILFLASPWLVSSAKEIARVTGLGNTLIGSTLLAFTTSFPELFSSIFAARMGLFDLVIGNIVGSNALNMVIFVAMDGVWTNGDIWSHISRSNIFTAAGVVLNMLLLAALWWPNWDKLIHYRRWGTLLMFFLSFLSFLPLFLWHARF